MSKEFKLITPVKINSHQGKILSDSKILTVGSCFSDNIGNLLSDHLFETMVNPFGTIFNPISIAKVLEIACNKEVIRKSDIESEGSKYFHFDFHSAFDAPSPEKVVDEINLAIKNVGEMIKSADMLILTFGTSIVYRLKSNNHLVSNCHKVPNHNFEKEFMPLESMEETMNKILKTITILNPTIQFICTVSPVRHTKDGLVHNSLSKSRLIELCHRLIEAHSNVSYFPSYEMMIDEMRDYRYYKSDLIHPSDLAVDIIWSRFVGTYFDDHASKKVKEIKALNAAKNHIPFARNSIEHQEFQKKQLEKIEQLSSIFPKTDFRTFREFFKK